MGLSKTIARTALHTGGAIHLVRRWRAGARILTYHRFSRENMDLLDRQCRHLRRYYNPVPLSEIDRAVRAGKPLPYNSLAITVDDGYRDFLLYAAPVLEAHRLPATVFLVSGFVDREAWLWWDPLIHALRRTVRPRLEISAGSFPLGDAAERAAAGDALIEAMKKLPNRSRIALLDEILKQLGVSFPEETPEEMAALTWDEIRGLRRRNVEFGAHTRTHPILSRVETACEVAAELSHCRKRIECELGEPVTHFAYPNGTAEDWNDEVVRAVEDAGYTLAVTTVPGINGKDDTRFRLKRIAVDPEMPYAYFTELLAGLH